MHILVLGAGALGSLIGARLSRTEAKVTLFTIDREHVAAVRKRGLEIEELDGSRRHYAIDCCDTARDLGEKMDLILVSVKSYATREAVESVEHCRRSSTVFLTLQNGVGNWQRIAELVGKEHVLAGVTAQGATLVEPGLVRHGGNGATHIGEPEGEPTARVHSVVGLFERAGLETRSSGGMELLIWEKLLVNVGINAITALTGIRNGGVAEIEEARELSRAAVEEAMLVARARGFEVRTDMVERVHSIACATAVNRSSMGQDVDNRKRTEIEAINGAIVRFGEEVGIAVPVNRTLVRLIKTAEKGYWGDRL